MSSPAPARPCSVRRGVDRAPPRSVTFNGTRFADVGQPLKCVVRDLQTSQMEAAAVVVDESTVVCVLPPVSPRSPPLVPAGRPAEGRAEPELSSEEGHDGLVKLTNLSSSFRSPLSMLVSPVALILVHLGSFSFFSSFHHLASFHSPARPATSALDAASSYRRWR